MRLCLTEGARNSLFHFVHFNRGTGVVIVPDFHFPGIRSSPALTQLLHREVVDNFHTVVLHLRSVCSCAPIKRAICHMYLTPPPPRCC